MQSSFAAASEVLASWSASLASPSLADSRDLAGWEQQRNSDHVNLSSTTSHPFISEPSIPPSPSPLHAALPQTTGHRQPQQEHHAERNSTTVPPSTIPSLLDSTITPRTRMSMLLSSLAINLFLPFMNGVMLGFGEIFSKNVLAGWIGWGLRTVAELHKLGVNNYVASRSQNVNNGLGVRPTGSMESSH
ncbi:hypothetical protein AZE42_09590 [Rhizopogon vesiculosus]|uniref:Uncharacterized protein n=1 Tax=Rhizopogon vesiculosus TaxID=180088 RepID=A0A1J8Q9L2_9AGAM|nr:hypothetical protein AZE42_09590 [Rhizopogon vesiculosus]